MDDKVVKRMEEIYEKRSRRMSKVDDNFFLCGHQYTKEQIEMNGIKTIVNFAAEINLVREIIMPLKLEVAHASFGVVDDPEESDFSKLIDPMFKFVETAKKPVLFHCVLGKSRSASFLIAYLMLKHTWSVHKANKYVKRTRGFINCKNFYPQLKELESRIRKKQPVIKPSL